MGGKVGIYKLEELKLKNGKTSYRLTWWEKDHKHRSKTFVSEKERSRWLKAVKKKERSAARIRARAERAGDYVARFSRLPVDVQHALLGGWDRISSAGGEVDDILAAADARAASMGGGITVEEAVARHVEDLAGRLSPRTIGERRIYLSMLAASHGNTPLCALTRGTCREWIEEGKTTAVRRHRHSVLSAFLNDCLRRDWLREFPLRGLRKDKMPMAEAVPIFTAAEAERVLREAEKSPFPERVSYIAIGLFAGLRPERELTDLAAANINIESRVIYVPHSRSKVRINRDVPISDNLFAWLRAYPVVRPVSAPRSFIRRIAAAAKVAWTPDVMRHTCASYRLALTRDAVRTADELGNSVDILKRHYANRKISPEEVARFWSIMPSGGVSGR